MIIISVGSHQIKLFMKKNQAKLLIGHGKHKPMTRKLKGWLTIPYKEMRKKSTNMQE